MKKTLIRASLLLALLPLHGCWTIQELLDDVDAVYDIDDDQFLVVYPFADPDFGDPWDSPLAHELAVATTEELYNNMDCNVISYNRVLELLVAAPADKDSETIGLDVRKLNPEKVANLVGADFVLLCKLIKWEMQDPLNLNLVRGTATCEVRLFELAKDQEDLGDARAALERLRKINNARAKAGLLKLEEVPLGGFFRGPTDLTVTVHYPDDYLNQYGDPFLNKEEVRSNLTRVLARRVAMLYYQHEPEDEEVYGSGN